MKVYIETYGCSANKSDSEIMAGLLKKNGFDIVPISSADVIIINTCFVKKPTEQKIFHRIEDLQKKFPWKKMIIVGCMPEVLSKKLREIAPNASLISTHHVKDIVNVVNAVIKGRRIELIGKSKNVKVCIEKFRENPLINIVQIASGCKSACSYCCVKLAKGDLFSYPIDLIVNDIKKGLKDGCKEIWLTSQDCGCYGFDINTNIAELLENIVKIRRKFFIRVGMMNPQHIYNFLDELIEVYKNPKIYKFIHIPVQSGSDKILKLMKRGYKIEKFRYIIKRFKKEFPYITISTDIIVGFPYETGNDFMKTVNLLKWLKPDVTNISRFGPRPFTEAEKMKMIENKIIKKRSKIIGEISKNISFLNNKKWVGWEGEVFINEIGKFKNQYIGRNFAYKPVLIESKKNLLGKFLNVKIIEAKNSHLVGKFKFSK